MRVAVTVFAALGQLTPALGFSTSFDSLCHERQRRVVELWAYRSNAYLQSLEQQTMEAASTATMEASVATMDPPTVSMDPPPLVTTHSSTTARNDHSVINDEDDLTNLSKTQKLMQQFQDAGTAGIISYALWELGFWLFSIPVVLFVYVQFTGHFPDFSNKDDVSKLSAEAFAFVNFARFAVPLRIGLALSTSPWIQENILDRFFPDNGKDKKGTQ